MADIEIKISGVDKLMAGMDKVGGQLDVTLRAAAEESINEILDTTGVRKYPPATAANAPPYPYYQRMKGTWTSPGNNRGESERFGPSWSTSQTPYGAKAINNTSYGVYLVDDALQASHMARIGWRKLGEVAKEKEPKIVRIFQAAIDRLIKLSGLT